MENNKRPVRVLWFANTPGLSAGHIGVSLAAGGWISSLQRLVEAVREVELGFVFYHEQAIAPFEHGGTRYFPVRPLGSSKRKRLTNRILGRAETDENLQAFLRAIESFQPDIIHVHGTEFPFGLILREVRHIPVVVSIQGNLTAYHGKYLSGVDLPGLWKGWRTGYAFYRADYHIWQKRMAVEQEIFGRAKFIFGRTDWDRRITQALAPQATYFHVDEVIRPGFYSLDWGAQRAGGAQRTGPAVFLTTSSPSIYKGFETVIDTARVLLRSGAAFEWQVAGLKADHPLVRLICRERQVADLSALHIRLPGVLNEGQLAERLMSCDAYVQVSHIENSPNSVCEAMLAGVPVIASFAGGTGSLLRDGSEGVLVQDGDPYALAGAMREAIGDPERSAAMAAEGRRVAQRRHHPETIVRQMMERYLEIIQKRQ